MSISFDATASERSEAARALFDKLDHDGHVNLLMLNGAELCILGGPKHPLFWEPLAASWLGSDPQPRNRMVEACTNMMIDRGLLIEEAPGSGYYPGAHFALSAELGITLAARCRPRFVISTHHSARLPTVNLFAIADEASPVRGIVLETPDMVPGTKQHAENMGPLGLLFYYVLHTPDSAAEHLADWTIRPAPVKRFHKQPPRTVSLVRPGNPESAGLRLSVVGDGTSARVEGLGVTGEYDKDGLRRIMGDLIAQGTR
jgi:hypothetical protein